MRKFIHEGTGDYWKMTMKTPSKWARWIIMRTNDRSDSTFKLIEGNKDFEKKYRLVNHFPFADIYELKPEYVKEMQPLPKLLNNK